jgi:hypothetical protein
LFVIVACSEETIRVVTAFPADRKARKFYSTQKGADRGKDD